MTLFPGDRCWRNQNTHLRAKNRKQRTGVGETRVQDGVQTYVFRSGCTLGVEMAEEFSDESLLLERSPLVTEVEKCLEDGSLDRVVGCVEDIVAVAVFVVVVVVVDGVGAVEGDGAGNINLEAEWFEK